MNQVSGSIAIGPGWAELVIPFFTPIKTIYLSTSEDGVPCCNGDVNWVASTILENAFVIYADIATNNCVISYLLILE